MASIEGPFAGNAKHRFTLRITKRFSFESAHVLPHHTGKCSRLHGHSYRLDVTVDGPLQTAGPATGMVVDFDDLATVVRRTVIDALDHRSLNDLLENPTSENIVGWIWRALDPVLPQLTELTLWETATASAMLRRGDI